MLMLNLQELLLQWLRNRSITINENDPHDRSQSIKVEYKSNHYQATCRPSITNIQSHREGYPTTLPKLSMRPASNSLASDAITWPSKLRGSYAWPRDGKGNTVNLNGDILREMSLHDHDSLKLSDNINYDSHAKVSLSPKFSNDWINNWIGTNEHQRAGLTELILRKNFEVLDPTKGHIKVWSRDVLVKQRSDAGMWVRTEAPSDWTIESPPPGMWHPKQKKFMYHRVVPDPSDLRVGRRRHRKYDAVIAVSDISTLESNHKWKMRDYGEVKRRIQILQITNNENSLNQTKTDPWMQINHENGLSGSSSVSTRLDVEGNYLVGQLEDLKNLSRDITEPPLSNVIEDVTLLARAVGGEGFSDITQDEVSALVNSEREGLSVEEVEEILNQPDDPEEFAGATDPVLSSKSIVKIIKLLEEAIDEAMEHNPILTRSSKFEHDCQAALYSYKEIDKDILRRLKQPLLTNYFDKTDK
ncbi:hypothetical protein QAD02_020344 [Eretmocerus hayati]|uniref:Uncharacterized protein n=1 Tax=Eretmocerus hayati TaxID=131215 RepID=A0ACC2PQD4_9HYME|nr:hypothetical protein QAD02_020344 [Eretmocerus hayati]